LGIRSEAVKKTVSVKATVFWIGELSGRSADEARRFESGIESDCVNPNERSIFLLAVYAAERRKKIERPIPSEFITPDGSMSSESRKPFDREKKAVTRSRTEELKTREGRIMKEAASPSEFGSS
jgi:hypothetical protein